MFKLAAMLVLKGIFRFACLAYLVKGHTHEDIDQAFAQMLALLFARHIATADEVHEAQCVPHASFLMVVTFMCSCTHNATSCVNRGRGPHDGHP